MVKKQRDTAKETSDNQKTIVEENILESINLTNIYIQKLTAEHIDVDDSSKSRSVEVQNELQIVNLTDDRLVIENKLKLDFEPKGPFELLLISTASFKIEKKFDEGVISKNLQQIAFPLLSNSSLVVAFISEKMFGVPVIVPPRVSSKKE